MTSIVDDRGYNQGYAWTPAQRVRMKRRALAIVEAIELKAGDRVLELGFGTGELAQMLSRNTQASVTGVDLCVPFIEQATQRLAGDRLNYVAADLSLPADRHRLGGGWGAVVGNGILHHLYFGIDAALVSMRQLLRPGGRFVFWEPNIFNPYIFSIFTFGPLRKLTKLEPDEMAFSPRWITSHLKTAGFSNIQVDFRDFLLPMMPEALVPVVVRAGDAIERMPLVNRLAQSLFIRATVS